MSAPGGQESLTTRSARNAAANWFQYAVAVAVAVWLTPILIRGVGAPAYGVWVLILQMAGYAAMLDLGVQNAVVVRVAAAHAHNDPVRLRAFLGTAFALELAAGIAVLCLGLVAAPHLASWFDLGGVAPATAQRTLQVMALVTAIGFGTGLFNSVLAGLQCYDLVAGFSVCSQVVRAGGMLLALGVRAGILGFALAALAGSLIGLVGARWASSKQTGHLQIGLQHATRAQFVQLIAHGSYLFVGNLGWRLAYGSDALLVGALFTAGDTAHFGLASNVLVLVAGIVAGFTGTLLPVATASVAVGDSEGSVRRYLVGTRTALFLGLPLAALLCLAAPELLALWVGADIGRPTGRILQVLAAAQIFLISNSAGVAVALGTGLHRLAAGLTLLEGCLNLALSYLLAMRLGVLGVAVGTLVPSAVFHGVVWPAIMCRTLALGPGRYLREALRPNVICLVCALLLWGLSALVSSPSAPWILARATAFVATYWIVGLRLCFSGEARVSAMAVLSSIIGRRS